jgi:hypothetical protein
MSRISLVVRDPSSSNYTRAKLRELLLAEAAFAPNHEVVTPSEEDLQARAQQSLEGDPGTPLPLSDLILSEGLRSIVRQRVAKSSPFLEGEHPLPEDGNFACLSENWGRYRQGSLVWTQKTNKACCHYIFERNVPSALAARQPDVSLVTAGVSISDYDFASWTLKLAVGLLGKYAPDFQGPVGEVGAILIGLLFPQESTADQVKELMTSIMADVVAEIARIVQKTSVQESVNQASGDIAIFQDRLTVEYPSKKTKGAPLKDLCDFMVDEAKYCEREILSLFRSTDAAVAVAGIGNFMLTVGLLLAVYQEAALVDPDPESQADRYTSEYAANIIRYADIYADYIDSLIPQLWDARTKWIVAPPKAHQSHWTDQYGNSVISVYYDSQDKYDPNHPITIKGETCTELEHSAGSDPYGNALKAYNDAMGWYNKGLLDDLRPYIQAATAQWRLLTWDPVPKNRQVSGKRTILWNVHLDDNFMQAGDRSGLIVLEPSSTEALVFRSQREPGTQIYFYLLYEEAGLTSICRFYSGVHSSPQLMWEERGYRVGFNASSSAAWSDESNKLVASLVARPVNWSVHLAEGFKSPGDTSGSTLPLDPGPDEVIVFRSQKDANNEIIFSIIYDTPGLTSICRYYSAGKVTSETRGQTVGGDGSSTVNWPGDASNSMAAFLPKDFKMSGPRIINWKVYLDSTFKKPVNTSGSVPYNPPPDNRGVFPSPDEIIVFRCPKEAGTEIVFSIIYDTSGLTSICRFCSNGVISSKQYGQRVGPGGSSTAAWPAYPWNNIAVYFA